MKKFIKSIKKYIYVIVVISLVACNAVTINANADHCNRNAKAIITLAKGVTTLALSQGHLARAYTENRINVDKRFIGVLAFLKNNSENIEKLRENDLRLRGLYEKNADNIKEMKEKPTFEYLKSVTVYVKGESYIINQADMNGIKVPVKTFISKWCGTGVVVKLDKDYTYVLTNRHVAGGYQKYQCSIYVANGKKDEPCEIIKLHKSQDLALLKFKNHIAGKQVVKGYAYPKITERVYSVGHSLGRPFIYGSGYFSGTVIEHDIYQLPCIGGQSGSGIFNKKGELLGLLYSVSGVRNGIGIQWDNTRANVVKGVYVQEFLKENLK